ncbi:MAG TPA: DinB family protein [Gemmatimonadales bacterium]|nr:DinB family protein [Gemmatimonadales bacterium]
MRSSREGAPDRAALLRLLHEAFVGPAWHGPSVAAALRGARAAEALWRPAQGRNTIWELVLHLAYSKHVVLRRLTGHAGRFPRRLRRPWWPALPRPADEAAWQRDRALLEDCHRALVAAVQAAPGAALARVTRRPLAEHVAGIALHDTYHGGQIRLLRKLREVR